MKYSTYTWDLVQALESASPASCNLLVPSTQTINQEKKQSRNEIYSHLRTQNLGLREVDLEPSPKRRSGKINMLEQGKNTVLKQ